MSDAPGPLLASGRAADVYDIGGGRVLRRTRTGRDVADEARIMRWLTAEGYPSPVVHDASGPDLVMEWIEGPTMLEDLERRPWTVPGHARTLARLQRDLNALEAPEWFPTDPSVPEGDAPVHLDLHPMNVILAPSGPVVIDWTNAHRGVGGFDAAVSYVLMRSYAVAGRVDRLGQRLICGTFALARGRAELLRHLPAAVTHRLADPNTTDDEARRLRALVA